MADPILFKLCFIRTEIQFWAFKISTIQYLAQNMFIIYACPEFCKKEKFYWSTKEKEILQLFTWFIFSSGVMRLVDYLSVMTLFGQDEKVHIVVDSGTGTTAVGLALGAVCLGCVWIPAYADCHHTRASTRYLCS